MFDPIWGLALIEFLGWENAIFVVKLLGRLIWLLVEALT
jgi:hypothetical protein